VSGRYLPEVPEASARETVASTYEDIRQVVGLPLVNLVYRTLAVVPDRLEAVWAELRPNLRAAAAGTGAAELLALAALPGRPVRIPPAALAAVGIGGGELERVAATLDAYGHANPRNLLAVSALLEGAEGGRGAAAREAGPGPATELLPMADLDSLAPSVRALLEEMGAPIAGAGTPVLVPSLFRHFAHNGCLLALVWTVLAPLVSSEGYARAVERVAVRARELARELPSPVACAEDPELRAVLERFAQVIPRMVVAGAAVRRALPAPRGKEPGAPGG